MSRARAPARRPAAGRRQIAGAACAAVLAGPALAQSSPPPSGNAEAARIVAEAAAACAEEGAGDLRMAPDAYTAADLDGDRTGDLVIDFGRAICTGDPAFFSGTGGAPIAFVLGGQTSTAFVGLGWSVTDAPPMPDLDGPARVILLRVHGSWCGAYGTSPCLRAITVTGGAFHTMGGALDEF